MVTPFDLDGKTAPLTGMRVVEVSAFVAAPSGGMTLAQLGAEVIRIDPPSGGLDYRRWPVTKNNVSLFWAGLNKAKRSVAIDFTKPEGRELAQALITAPGDDAGMLLTNMPPRGWLDYETLKIQRPDLIQLTVQGDRHGGSAVDYTLNPRLGLPSITGPSDYSGVVNHVLPAWDLVTGQMAATGLLAAERQRYRSRQSKKNGLGQHLKLPLEDVGLSVMAGLGFIAEAEQGIERPRYGNHLFGAMGRDFFTRDRQQIMVVGLTKKQWKSLLTALSLDAELARLADQLNADLSLEGERFRYRDEICTLVEAEISRLDCEDLAARFEQHGVCWGKYQTVGELIQSDPACSIDNPLFSRVQQPGIGESLTPTIALNSSLGRLAPAPAPQLGEHTEQILVDVLGADSSTLAGWVDRKIIAIL